MTVKIQPMAEEQNIPVKAEDLRVSLEGAEAFQGRVDARVYLKKVDLLIEVFAALERVYLESDRRKTRFLIADQKRVNPYITELHPISLKSGYGVYEALDWGLTQLRQIESGKPVDSRISVSTLEKIAKLPPDPDEDFARNFKLNGRSKPISFSNNFKINALKAAEKKRLVTEKLPLFSGKVLGEVRGRLLALDSVGGDKAIIVPAIGPSQIECKFPDTMRDSIGEFYNAKIIAKGLLHYTKESPFPQFIEVNNGDISLDRKIGKKVSLLKLRGIFSSENDGEVFA